MLEVGFIKGDLLEGGVDQIHDGLYLHTRGSSRELAINHWGFGKMLILLGEIQSSRESFMRGFVADKLIDQCESFLKRTKQNSVERFKRLENFPVPSEVQVQDSLDESTRWDLGDFLTQSHTTLAQVFAPRAKKTLHDQRNLDYDLVARELRDLALESVNNGVFLETAPDRTRVAWVNNSHPGAKELDPVVIRLNIAFRERLTSLGFERGVIEKRNGYELSVIGLENAKRFPSNPLVDGPFISATAATPEIQQVLSAVLTQLYGQGILERRDPLNAVEIAKQQSGESLYSHKEYPLLVRKEFGNDWNE